MSEKIISKEKKVLMNDIPLGGYLRIAGKEGTYQKIDGNRAKLVNTHTQLSHEGLPESGRGNFVEEDNIFDVDRATEVTEIKFPIARKYR